METRLAVLLAGISMVSFAGCTSVPYDPATSTDTTPPDIGIRVTGEGPTSTWDPNRNMFNPAVPITPVEVGSRQLGTPLPSIRVHERGTVNVVATAQDNESGIRGLKLVCQRTVYYNWDAANQTEAQALLAPVVKQQTNQPGSGGVPAIGVQQMVLDMHGQMVFASAQGNPIRGHRVAVTCSAETSNFNALLVQSQGVVIWAQDRTIQP